ncbi:MAG: membrane-bound lytic murein transglycosylase MltF [Neptuniibacter caesariensis]|uniref:Membrane-bound lytic murein transglycosylase F n=1 Tax=Neptuniibacter caesariensis TaxID=207954 RepID=A0A2G6JNC9_NEPCE|nr:MAG: membrane-bound lytic murein transglycosylase MltF [Neptuniibacter caesariensis]
MFDICRKKHTTTLLTILILLSTPALLSWNNKTQLEAITESGSLNFVTRNSPNTYFIEKGQPAGFEYELAKAYAEHLGIKLKLILPNSFSVIFTAIKERKGHLAGAMLTASTARKKDYEFTAPYLHTTTAVIYRETQGQTAPKDLEDLIQKNKKLVVFANSSHIDLLKKLKETHPTLSWEETSEYTAVELLEQVYNKKIDYTITDAIAFDSQRSFFPGLEKAFDLNKPQPIAWMYAKNSDQSLKKSLQEFMDLESTKELITELHQKYFNRNNPFGFYDTAAFKRDIRTRFPHIEQYFLMAEQETGIDWHLLAAIAYQESHWNPAAVSPTGVKGIMMLTHAAAKEVGVTDRTDPEQSIIGGAHYLISVKKKIPERIPDPDHTWLALAGYNVGYGHLEDARVLTKRAGKDPDKWDDVKQYLPLLTQEKYYSTVRYGYARGYEPVHYVSNIQKYMKLLSWEMKFMQAGWSDEETETDAEARKNTETNTGNEGKDNNTAEEGQETTISVGDMFFPDI